MLNDDSKLDNAADSCFILESLCRSDLRLITVESSHSSGM